MKVTSDARKLILDIPQGGKIDLTEIVEEM